MSQFEHDHEFRANIAAELKKNQIFPLLTGALLALAPLVRQPQVSADARLQSGEDLREDLVAARDGVVWWCGK